MAVLRKSFRNFSLKNSSLTIRILALLIIAGGITTILILLLKKKPEIRDNRISIYASSIKNKWYKPENAFDKKRKTAWTPKSTTGGKYEWIKASFSKPILLSGIRMINGFGHNHKRYGDLYEKNNRVKAVRIRLSGSVVSYYWVLKDNNSDFQSFTLPAPRKTSFVQIFIHDIYKGSLWDDLSISEIKFW